jgi:hypothetical protein
MAQLSGRMQTSAVGAQKTRSRQYLLSMAVLSIGSSLRSDAQTISNPVLQAIQEAYYA